MGKVYRSPARYCTVVRVDPRTLLMPTVASFLPTKGPCGTVVGGGGGSLWISGTVQQGQGGQGTADAPPHRVKSEVWIVTGSSDALEAVGTRAKDGLAFATRVDTGATAENLSTVRRSENEAVSGGVTRQTRDVPARTRNERQPSAGERSINRGCTLLLVHRWQVTPSAE